jgi:tetratricopeptide (TPR) repeat protein
LAANHQGDFAAARSYHKEALRIYRDLGDRMGRGRMLDALAMVCYNEGDFAAGIRFSEQGLHLCRETGNRYDEVWATIQISYGSWCQGDYARAKACLERALPICREIRHPGTEMLALLGLGMTLDTLGDYAQARAWYEQAWATGLVTGRSPGGGHRVWRSLLCHHRDDDEAARRYARQALERYTARADDLGKATALTVLGHALTGLGDWTGAAGAYRQALDLRKGVGQLYLVAEPLAGLARAAQAQGEPAQAFAHADEILRCLEDYPKLEGTMEPLRIYLTCYQALRAHEDPRADDVLHAAHSLLQERAHKIDDEALRRSYLENVAAHREIVAEFRRIHG